MFHKKKNSTLEYFAEGLRNENDGLFEAAVLDYENALREQEKLRFRDEQLTAKIIEKLKVLHTTISYNSNFLQPLYKPAI